MKRAPMSIGKEGEPMRLSDFSPEFLKSIRPWHISASTVEINPQLAARAHANLQQESQASAPISLTKPLPQVRHFLTPYLRMHWKEGTPDDMKQILIYLSRSMDPQYEAWQVVRKIRAEEVVGASALPFTGWEGLYAGLGWSSVAITVDLKNTATDFMDKLKKFYPGAILSYRIVTRILRGEYEDPLAFAAISSFFGMQLQHKKRELEQIRARTPAAQSRYNDFRQDTYTLIRELPPLNYDIKFSVSDQQIYPLPTRAVEHANIVTDEQFDFLDIVGICGQPLLRQIQAMLPILPTKPHSYLRAGY